MASEAYPKAVTCIHRLTLWIVTRSGEGNPCLLSYAPLHDLESVWWLLVWAFLHFYPQPKFLYDDPALRRQLDLYVKSFGSDQDYCRCALIHPFMHANILAPSIRKTVIPGLIESMRSYLYNHYETVERKFPVSADLFDESHFEVLQHVTAAGIDHLGTVHSLTGLSKREAGEDSGGLAPVEYLRSV